MSWKAGVAAELIGMAVGTVGERIYQAKLLIETADLLAWTVLVVAASWACERVLVWLLRVSGPVAWRAAVRAHGCGSRGRAGGSAGGRAAAELALAVGDRAPWAPALDGLVLRVSAGSVLDQAHILKHHGARRALARRQRKQRRLAHALSGEAAHRDG